jgi:outer membrane protein
MQALRWILLGILIALFGISSIPAQAANVAKIGIVDFQRILETSSSGKKAQAEINSQGKKMEAELKKKGAVIEESKKKLEREALIMSKEMREQKARELRIQVNDLKTLQQKYMQEFKAREQKLVQEIQKKIVDAVAQIGKKGGYLLILEKREGGVLYAPKTIDITDQLIKILNAPSKKK